MVWPPRYPSPEVLKAEIAAMIEAVRMVLEKHGKIEAMHVQGSACKEWDSPIDYVPNMSDVDIHISAELDPDLNLSMTLSEEIETEYRQRISTPYHIPIVQISFLQELHSQVRYYPCPPSTVHHMKGPLHEYKDPDMIAAQLRAVEQLLENKAFIEGKHRRLFYKEGYALGRLMLDIAWRISSIGPHVLTLHGMPYTEAWSKNRTAIVAALESCGEVTLARSYEKFYLCGWEHFLSQGADTAATREGIRAGWNTLLTGIAIAEARRNP
jgi:hypothetical protein